MRQDEERRQSTTTPQALRQGNRAVAKATRYPEGGTSTNTGPGHHKGPTTGGGRQQEIGEESQQQPRKRQTQRSPTTPREAHKGQRKRHPQKRRQKHKHSKQHHKEEPGTRGKETRNQGQTNGKESTAHTMNTQTNDQTTKRGGQEGNWTQKGRKRPHHTVASGGKSLHGAQGQGAQETKMVEKRNTKPRGEKKKGEGRYVILRVVYSR